MDIQFPCGNQTATLKVPEQAQDRVEVLQSGPAPVLSQPEKALDEALAKPLGTAPLAQLAKGAKSACVVVSDQTRPAPNQLMLPALLKCLQSAGLGPEAITILIAAGMHEPVRGVALAELLGPDIAEQYRVVNHDCRDAGQMREIARIEGHAIQVNQTYLDADLKILTGLIEPHPFAGFSGGGKSILPGIASFETMRFMHSFDLLDRESVASAAVQGNPFQEYVQQAARAAGADFVLNVLQDKQRRLIGIFAGALDEVFRAGCALAEKTQVASPSEPADLVVASSGGYPLDATLYQSCKGLMSACQILKPHGNVIWVAGCSQGLGGEEFCKMAAQHRDYASFKAHYAKPQNFTVDQWGAQAYFKARQKAGRVWLYSPGLNYVQARELGLTKVENLDALFAGLATYSQHIELLPEGPYLACKPSW